MLISTSRKPSQKTRKLCKNLSHTLNYPYVNRGKSSIHDLQVKSKQLEQEGIILIYEIKGNPSKITFLDISGEETFNMQISAETTNDRLNIRPSQLIIKQDFPDLNPLAKLLNLPLENNTLENCIHMRKSNNREKSNGYIAAIDFYNKFGEITDFKINIKKLSNLGV